MTLDLRPEIAAALEALASAKGLSVEDYIEQLVEHELPLKLEDATPSEGSGMVWVGGPCFRDVAKGWEAFCIFPVTESNTWLKLLKWRVAQPFNSSLRTRVYHEIVSLRYVHSEL